MRSRVPGLARTAGAAAAGVLLLSAGTAAAAPAAEPAARATASRGPAAAPVPAASEVDANSLSSKRTWQSIAAEDNSTDTILAATAGGSALVSLACLAMHIRVRRAAKSGPHTPDFPSVSAPFTMPVETPDARPAMSPALWLENMEPAQEPTEPPQIPLPAPPPPPNHNALDSVWSISAASDGGAETGTDHAAAPEAAGTESPNADVTMADPPPNPTWRPPATG
ncbi:hypothetical protein LO772_22515 [Yinghuangia sp. ASG 101]|uniref:hypothetical protein n=1 Tax=Yinghuangia sp. ASG 101 TaxID=2896848 RepID=UPI001E4D6784|nr:hypothetical protein [Yinghuangia sp. ASG 101]UGQ09679.1 hypothetical protein LO772_22515 [Yinghuangia sp. ASG 101]